MERSSSRRRISVCIAGLAALMFGVGTPAGAAISASPDAGLRTIAECLSARDRVLDVRGVQWVTRAKENFKYRAVRNLPVPAGGRILKDQIVVLTGAKWKKFKGWRLRRVEAIVVVDGKDKVMVFITNNTRWSAGSVCDLYRARWEIEVFFKQVKQTLKLSGFVGYSANAIRWQVWTALLVYVLLRFAAHLSAWGHSFTRLFTVVRAAMWERLDLPGLLRVYGTAGGSFKLLGAAHSAWLPGFAPPNS